VGNKLDISNPEKVAVFQKYDSKILFISAKDTKSIEILKTQLIHTLDLHKIDTGATIITNARHFDALQKIKNSLEEVLLGLKNGVSSDLLAIDLRQALFHIGSLTGEITSDDILGNIFANFCIGK
jgi:tRNA modification GTPase